MEQGTSGAEFGYDLPGQGSKVAVLNTNNVPGGAGRLEYALPELDIMEAMGQKGYVYSGPVVDNNFVNGAKAYLGSSITKNNPAYLFGKSSFFYGESGKISGIEFTSTSGGFLGLGTGTHMGLSSMDLGNGGSINGFSNGALIYTANQEGGFSYDPSLNIPANGQPKITAVLTTIIPGLATPANVTLSIDQFGHATADFGSRYFFLPENIGTPSGSNSSSSKNTENTNNPPLTNTPSTPPLGEFITQKQGNGYVNFVVKDGSWILSLNNNVTSLNGLVSFLPSFLGEHYFAGDSTKSVFNSFISGIQDHGVNQPKGYIYAANNPNGSLVGHLVNINQNGFSESGSIRSGWQNINAKASVFFDQTGTDSVISGDATLGNVSFWVTNGGTTWEDNSFKVGSISLPGGNPQNVKAFIDHTLGTGQPVIQFGGVNPLVLAQISQPVAKNSATGTSLNNSTEPEGRKLTVVPYNGITYAQGDQKVDFILPNLNSPNASLSGDFRKVTLTNGTGYDWVTTGVQTGANSNVNGIYQVGGRSIVFDQFGTTKGNNAWRAIAAAGNNDMYSLLNIKTTDGSKTDMLFKFKYLEYGKDNHIVQNGIVLSADKGMVDAFGGTGTIKDAVISEDASGARNLTFSVKSDNLVAGKGIIWASQLGQTSNPFEASNASGAPQPFNLIIDSSKDKSHLISSGDAQFAVNFNSLGNGTATQNYANTDLTNKIGHPLALFDLDSPSLGPDAPIGTGTLTGDKVYLNNNLMPKGGDNVSLELKQTGSISFDEIVSMKQADAILSAAKPRTLTQEETIKTIGADGKIQSTTFPAGSTIVEVLQLPEDITVKTENGIKTLYPKGEPIVVTPAFQQFLELSDQGRQVTQAAVPTSEITINGKGEITSMAFGQNGTGEFLPVRFLNGATAQIFNPYYPDIENGQLKLTVTGNGLPVIASQISDNSMENKKNPPAPSAVFDFTGVGTGIDNTLYRALGLSPSFGIQALGASTTKPFAGLGTPPTPTFTVVGGMGNLTGNGTAQYMISMDSPTTGNGWGLYDNNVKLIDNTPFNLNLFDVISNDAAHTVVATRTLDGNTLNGQNVFLFKSDQSLDYPENLSAAEKAKLGSWPRQVRATIHLLSWKL